jgi:monoamine oxidase
MALVDSRNLTRRRALALGAASAVVAGTWPPACAPARAQGGVGAPAVLRGDLVVERDVAILGAGAAGLAAAAECARLGLSYLCIEARARVGGRVFTDESLGAPFDAGALFLHWAERNPWRAEAGRLGVALVDEPAGSFRVVTAQETSPEQGQRRRGQFRRLSTLLEGAGVPDLSVAEIAAREGLSEAASGLTRMALGEEPGRVSARDYARLWSGDDLVAPEGFGRLVAACARGLDVRTGVAALGVAWDGAGVSIETTRGTLRARVAIVTLPVGVLKAGAVAFRPELPAATLRALDGLEMGVLSKIALAFDGERFGMSGPADIVLAQGETLIDFDCWAFERPLVVGYVGGDAAREMARLGPDGAVASALDAFALAVGGEARRRFRGGRFYGWADDPLARGAYSHALPGRAGARAELATPVGDRLIFAGEATGGEGGDFGGAMTAGGAYLAGRNAARAAAALTRG